MKNLVYPITVACACLTAIPMAVVGVSLVPRANAAEQVCVATVTAETSGASVREAVDVIALCNTRQPSSIQSLKPIAQTPMGSPAMKPSQTRSNSLQERDSQPSYCPPVPNVEASGLFYYFEVIHGCRYGS